MNIQFFAESDEDRSYRRKKTNMPAWLNRKVICLAAVAVAVVILVAVLACVFLGGGRGFDLADRSVTYQVFDDDTLYFLVGGQKLDSKLDAEQVIEWNVSMDGQVVSFTVEEDGDQILYILSGEDLLWIAEEPEQIMMSETGSALAYIIEEELSLYNISKKSAQKISSAAYAISAISPDGKTVAYIDTEGFTMVYSDGKTYELGNEVEVLSISDGGKYIYGIGQNEDWEDCLYLYSLKGQVGLVAADIDLDATYYTNADHDQLIFRAAGKSGYKWYAVEGKELEEDQHTLASTDIFQPLLPSLLQTFEGEGLTALGVDSLTDLVYTSLDTDDTSMKLIYLGSDWDTSTLVSKVVEAQIGSDGQTIYYFKGNKVYSIAVKAGAQSEELAEDVEEYYVCPDGSGFYYVDTEGSAFYQSGSKVKALSADVTQLWVTHDGYALFVTSDGLNSSLYSTKQGGKVTLVEEYFQGTVITCGDCTYYLDYVNEASYTDYSVTLYVATKGANFTELGSFDVKVG